MRIKGIEVNPAKFNGIQLNAKSFKENGKFKVNHRNSKKFKRIEKKFNYIQWNSK